MLWPNTIYDKTPLFSHPIVRLDTWEAVEKCVEVTVPAGLRAGLGWISAEKIPWSAIGGHEDVKRKLMRAIDWPLRRPEAFKRLGIRPSKGVLLYGPPGCGKTRLVRAAASNTGNHNIILGVKIPFQV